MGVELTVKIPHGGVQVRVRLVVQGPHQGRRWKGAPRPVLQAGDRPEELPALPAEGAGQGLHLRLVPPRGERMITDAEIAELKELCDRAQVHLDRVGNTAFFSVPETPERWIAFPGDIDVARWVVEGLSALPRLLAELEEARKIMNVLGILVVAGIQIWNLDDGRTIVLLSPSAFRGLPDGTVLLSITGEEVTKGRDYIDQDTRGPGEGYLAFGLLLPSGEKP